jgi:hypothetical protein
MISAQATFERLDGLSRHRVLSPAESCMLERSLNAIDAETAVSVERGWTADQLDRFFDFIADEWTISAAARAVGKTRNAGAGMFHRVRRGMGWQGA